MAVLSAIGGCSAVGEEQDAAPSAEVAWAGTVCEAVADGAAKVPHFPRVDPSDPEKAKQGFVDHLRTLSGALDGVRDAIKEAGVPPVSDGKSAFNQAVKRLGSSVKSMDQVAAKLEKTAANDQKAMREALTSAQSAVEKAGTANGLIKKLRTNKALDQAASKAAACREFGA